jgi:hypothetical protein
MIQQKLGVWGTTADDQILLHDLFCQRIPRLKPNIFLHDSELFVLDVHERFADAVWAESNAKSGMLLDTNVTQRWVASYRDHDIVFMDNGCSVDYGTMDPALGLERVTAHKGGGCHPAPWLGQNRPCFEHGFFVKCGTHRSNSSIGFPGPSTRNMVPFQLDFHPGRSCRSVATTLSHTRTSLWSRDGSISWPNFRSDFDGGSQASISTPRVSINGRAVIGCWSGQSI